MRSRSACFVSICQEDEIKSLESAESAIERCETMPSGDRERSKIRVCPRAGRRPGSPAKASQLLLDTRGLALNADMLLRDDGTHGVPRLRVVHAARAHHTLVGQQPQQTELRKPAEHNMMPIRNHYRAPPQARSLMMRVLCHQCRQPHIDVGENGLRGRRHRRRAAAGRGRLSVDAERARWRR